MHMARHCERLYCVDISNAYLALLTENMQQRGVTNCEPLRSSELEALQSGEVVP